MLKTLYKAMTHRVPGQLKAIYDDDRLLKIYENFSKVGAIITSGFNCDNPVEYTEKHRLCCGLVLLGFVDALSQATRLSDRQFFDLWGGFSYDANLSRSESVHLLVYHYKLEQRVGELAVDLILTGGMAFNNFASGDAKAMLGAAISAMAKIEDSRFPSTFQEL